MDDLLQKYNDYTRLKNRHGVHYIKLFPIDSKYIQKTKLHQWCIIYL